MKAIIIIILVVTELFDCFLNLLSWKSNKNPMPVNVRDVYDSDTYKKRNAYRMEKLKLGTARGIVFLILIVSSLIFDWFTRFFSMLETYTPDVNIQNFLLASAMFLIWLVVSVIFDAVETFKTETKYGFNKVTVKTFLHDIFLKIFIGAALLVITFFVDLGDVDIGNKTLEFFIAAAIFIGVFAVVLFFAPYLFRLFNKFSPVPEGLLKDKITLLMQKTKFKAKVFVMDASKRTTKLNALITGYGITRTVALYDNLIDKMSEEEVAAVLAHEIGHNKKGHLFKRAAVVLLLAVVLMFLIEFAILNPNVSEAFGFESANTAFIIFLFLIGYKPVLLLLNIPLKSMSRRHEFAADAYAKENASAVNLVSALKKLAKENYSNLTPHPLVVFMTYSHPPISERIAALGAGAGT